MLRRVTLGVAALALVAGGAAVVVVLRKAPAPPAQPIALASPPESAVEDAGLPLEVHVEEPKGPKVCVRARSRLVPNAEVATSSQSLHTGDDGCVQLDLPPTTRELHVCARASGGAACTTASPISPDSWLPITLELGASGKLRVEVADLRGHPVALAEVTVSTHRAVWKERASPNGVAVLEHLPVGAAEVSAHADGYISEASGSADVVPSDQTKVRLRLALGVTLAGVVFDDDGKPVSNAELTAVDGSGRSPRAAHGDEHGHFALTGLAPGPYDVWVDTPELASATFEAIAPDTRLQLRLHKGLDLTVKVTGPDGKPLAADVAAVPESRAPRTNQPTNDEGIAVFSHFPLGAIQLLATADSSSDSACNSTRGVRFTLDREQDHAEIQFQRGETIEGRIVDSHGRPLDGTVHATPLDSNVFDDVAAAPGAAEVSTQDGGFSLRCLEARAYRLAAHVDGSRSSDTVIPIVQAGSRGVEIVCRANVNVTGRVTGPHGAALPFFDVEHQRFQAVDGRFEVSVAPDQAQLLVEAPGLVARTVAIEVSQAMPKDVGTVQLTQATPLRGRVLDAQTHLPIAQARIGPLEERFAEVLTNAQGEFTVETGTDSPRVHISHPDYVPATTQLSPGADVELRAGTQIKGHVFDRRGEPVAAAEIIASHDGAYRFATLDHDGAFTLSGIEPGSWRVGVSPEARLGITSLAVEPQTVEVPADGIADLVFHERTGGADLTVETNLLEPSSLLRACLLPSDVPMPRTASELQKLLSTSQYEGRPVRSAFVFDAVPPGEYTFALARLGSIDREPVADCHFEKISVSGNGPMRWTARPRPVTLEIDAAFSW